MKKYSVKLSTIQRDEIKPSELAKLFKTNLSKEILLSRKPRSIVYASLNLINFKKLVNSKHSINIYAKKTLQAWLKTKVKAEKAELYFIGTILRFKALPYSYKEILLQRAQKDLFEVNNLLSYYLTLPFIKSFIESNATPRNHNDATLLVFYNRTQNKLRIMLNYIQNDLDNFAIRAAETIEIDKFLNGSDIHHELEVHQYLPYLDMVYNNKLKHEIDFERLDNRKINVFRNKMFINGIGKMVDSGLTETELNNILVKINTSKYLEYVINNSSKLPIIGNRTEIFTELKYLFNKKKWYGFYALALPQVEGLFADMLKVASPGKNLQSALPAKVGAARSYHALSDKFFDYYQYYLPEQRNKFSHTGYDEDIKVKSYHILFDLWHLINSFMGMEIPLLELIRATEKGISYFDNISSMTHFILLVRTIDKLKGFQDKRAVIKDYFFNFLNGIEANSFFKALQHDFNQAFIEFDDKFILSAHVYGKGDVSFVKMSKGELYKKIDIIKKTMTHGIVFLFEDALKLLLNIYEFVYNIEKAFEDLPTNFLNASKGFYANNKAELEKISLLEFNKNFDLEISSDFMPFTNISFTHVNFLPQH